MYSVEYSRVVEVVETKSSVGSGTKEDPYRTVMEYWSTEGQLLAIRDGFKDDPKYFRGRGVVR